MFELIIAWHVISMKGTANQSWLNTFPSTHMKVTLNPTGGAGVKSKNAWWLNNKLPTQKHISFGSKSCVAYCNISHDLHRLNIFNVEVLNMVVCVIRYFIIYFQNPSINITLNSANNSKEAWKLILILTQPYHKRFIIVYGGPFKQFSMWKLCSIAKHSPSQNDIMF